MESPAAAAACLRLGPHIEVAVGMHAVWLADVLVATAQVLQHPGVCSMFAECVLNPFPPPFLQQQSNRGQFFTFEKARETIDQQL